MNRVSEQQWQQAKAVFSEALEHPKLDREQFVEQACAGDSTLRAEVESLLKSYEQAQSFMESPAIESAAEEFAGRRQFEVGQRVKHYEIIKLIGEGGMGEVYLARDTILGRRIALKMLPEYVRGDADRLRRFKQEARTASTLSHPNVCVIHEVGETDEGHPFITMEFIEGITLRQRMNDGRLKLSEALDIAVQIGDALCAAHEAGIVHRDIKPENVMIRRDGYVKVLDFGLAKLAEHSRRGTTSASMSTLMFNSSPGTVMGTAAYMSPEQARGVAVDLRTDIWSLGVVLYEMVSGQTPFTGATPTDVVISIVEREQAPLAQHFAATPSELERIVRKALRKDPEERYQLAKEMAIDLRSLRRELELDRSLTPGFSDTVHSGSTAAEVRASTGEERAVNTDQLKTPHLTSALPLQQRIPIMRYALMLLGLVVMAGAAFGIYKLLSVSSTNTKPGHFEQINVTKLTTNGSALFATVSPDGKYVAYINGVGGKESLWVRQVSSAGNLEIVPPRDGHYGGLLFSGDGDFIYYGYAPAGSNNGEIYRVPVLGQGATPVKIDPSEGPAALSHDSKRKAFIKYDREKQTDSLMIANADGSNEQSLAVRKWPERFSFSLITTPVWSADDQTLNLGMVLNDERGYYINLYEFRLSDRTERTIPLNPQRFESPYNATVLSDLSGVVMSAKAQGASFAQVWYLGRDGSARTITNDLSDYRDAHLTADSRALVTVQTQFLSNLWVGRRDNPNETTQITSGFGRYFDVSSAPDGKIIYASDASGSADIYEMTPDGTSVRQLTTGMKRNYAPSISPDNRFIAFHSNRSGSFQVWRMDRDGSNPVQMTRGNSESNWPRFSADGKWIFYQHFESGVPTTIWKVAVEGGTPVKMIEGFALRPTPSPDGKYLACWWTEGQQQSRWRSLVISLETGKQVRSFELPPLVTIQWDTNLRWSADSRNLIYVEQRGGIENLNAQPIEGGPARQLTNYNDAKLFSHDVAHDGTLITSRGVITTDVVLISDANN